MDAAAWAQRISEGDRRSIARALTAVENHTEAADGLLPELQSFLGRARVIGFTGPPGAGKSTLVAACIGACRARDLTVGVVAVDPSSPYSGGAVLGDRIRMHEHAADPEVFIRSLASRGHLGGLCLAAARVIDVLDAAGKDVVMVETVGTGQSEVEVADVADCKVVVVAPGLGDEVQALKAGVLEIADILVVNKSDLAYADRCEADLLQMLSMRSTDIEIPILRTCARNGDGVESLLDAIVTPDPAGPGRNGGLRLRRALINESMRLLQQQLMEDPDLDAACRDVQDGSRSLQAAAAGLLRNRS